MARKPRIPTPEEIQTIRDLKAKGQSDSYITKALGLGSRNTFIKWKKMAEAANEQGETIGEQIERAIKEGREECRHRHLELAQDALALRLGVYEYTEVKRERKMNIETEQYELVPVEEKTKFVMPSDTLIMFTLVNKDPDNWQSINRANDTKTQDVLPDGASVIVEEEGEIEE